MSVDVRRPRQYDEMLKKLCHDDSSIFATYKDALVFAACLGFDRGKKVPFEDKGERVRKEVFNGQYDDTIFHCIGLAETGDPAIMGAAREEDRVRIFEEYACGGLQILEAEVYSAGGAWDQQLLALVAKRSKGKESVLDDITKAMTF